jgi:hypothetical protein
MRSGAARDREHQPRMGAMRKILFRTAAKLICCAAHYSRTQEKLMKRVFSIAAVAMVIVNGAGAMAAELPTFETTGFPISPVQMQAVGAAEVREQPPVATPTVDGMPASPHQLSVLAPRAKRTAAATAPNTGFAAR